MKSDDVFIKRNEKASTISKIIKDGDILSKCIENNWIDNIVSVKQKIGEPSVHGEVHLGKIHGFPKVSIVLKKIPLTRDVRKILAKNIDGINIVEATGIFSEIFFLYITDTMVRKNITPHVPRLLGKSICIDGDCGFNRSKRHHDSNGCVILYLEKANDTLDKFLDTRSLSREELLTIFLQIYIGLYIVKKSFRMAHNDLHGDNVLYYTIPKKSKLDIIQHKIGNKTISYPNIGYIMYIWDFGMSSIPGTLEPDDLSWFLHNEKQRKYIEEPLYDFAKILSSLRYHSGKTEKDKIIRKNVSSTIKDILKSFRGDLKKIIFDLYDVISIEHYERTGKPLDDYDVLHKFNTNKKITQKNWENAINKASEVK